MPDVEVTQERLDDWFTAVDPQIRRLSQLATTVEHNRATLADADVDRFVNDVNNSLLEALDQVLAALTDAKARLWLGMSTEEFARGLKATATKPDLRVIPRAEQD